jgi:hypothetical protein
MAENSNYTFRDLTLSEVWILIKTFCAGVFACSFIFVLPFVLFYSTLKGVDTMTGSETISKWIAYLFSSVILLWVVFNIHKVFLGIGKYFTDLANFTADLSKTKKIVFTILIFLYLYCLFHFWIITFFVFVLVLLPASFTYTEYMRLLKNKELEQN